MLYDRTIAKFLLAITTAFYAYYVLWIGVTPFIDPSHFTQRLFPPREYGLLLAAVVMTSGLGLAMTAASVHTIRQTGTEGEGSGKFALAVWNDKEAREPSSS
ncbi:putative dolichol phosphate-mannose biosynthesis regulatory protein [Trypanosoma conorhini]|uniref:Dolichol phosphate-mannose biosynthesis regulatory protein n=1 Tax=Trypanosoma conorhini TaxID=83891 RepID=A0A422PWQ6_9TRYP|nr:putative dolichol phosphate-mannose biosynthesis regulatory protein [Trypanosoma conorhini]RNF22239.1 putative dolichol phosphate-mannose biosynthesis regulatory protein [Trypanosoma conorhini]